MQESNFLLSQQESGKVKGYYTNNNKFWKEVRDNKIYSRVPWDSDLGMAAMAMPSKN
jgi:hypothetical protein